MVAHWTNISGNLPNEPVWSLQIGTRSGTLYIGADDGVYVTANFGASWSRLGTGLPNAQVFQIELNRNLHILGAGTHGRYRRVQTWHSAKVILCDVGAMASLSHFPQVRLAAESDSRNYEATHARQGRENLPAPRRLS